MTFGEKVDKIRLSKNMLIHDIYRLSGVHCKTINMIIQGKKAPSP